MNIYLMKSELQVLSMFLGEKIVEAKCKMEQYNAENKRKEASLYTIVFTSLNEIKAKIDKGESEAKDE